MVTTKSLHKNINMHSVVWWYNRNINQHDLLTVINVKGQVIRVGTYIIFGKNLDFVICRKLLWCHILKPTELSTRPITAAVDNAITNHMSQNIMWLKLTSRATAVHVFYGAVQFNGFWMLQSCKQLQRSKTFSVTSFSNVFLGMFNFVQSCDAVIVSEPFWVVLDLWVFATCGCFDLF